MKNWLLNILILAMLALLYYAGIFDLIGQKSFHIFAFVLVIIMFAIGFFVIGNPLDDKKK